MIRIILRANGLPKFPDQHLDSKRLLADCQHPVGGAFVQERVCGGDTREGRGGKGSRRHDDLEFCHLGINVHFVSILSSRQ
jgi:hypothetical protein